MTVTPPPDPLAALAAARWPRVLDRLLRGVGHDLSNRVQNLRSLDLLLEEGEDDDPHGVPALLQAEVGKLEETVALLRLVPGEGEGEVPEPIHLPEFVPPLVRLSRMQRGVREVERTLTEDTDLSPTRAPWSLLGRTVLVLLAEAAEAAEDREHRMEIRLRSLDGDPAVEVRVPGAAREGTRMPAAPVEPVRMEPLARFLGGRMEEEETGEARVLRLVLPSMGRRRREGREG